MKKLYILSTLILTTIFLFASNTLYSQVSDKTITLDSENEGGVYTARDLVDLKPGFSFTPAPAPAQPKIIELTWNYSGLYVGWTPTATIGSYTGYGTPLQSVSNFYYLVEVIENLRSDLDNHFGPEWTFFTSFNTNVSVTIRVKNTSDYSFLGNYNSSVVLQSYVPANDGTFEAKIDESLVFDVEYQTTQPDPNRSLNKNLPVGTIPGSFDVSPTGAATYTIPIEVPPGTAGMQPNLAISYNSQGGNGLLGVGWNLAGLSAITRVPATLYHDNIVDGVDFDAYDRFALDGNRLTDLNGGPYWAAGDKYRTEIESFSIIESFGTKGQGPLYFKVYTKDGKILEYGNTASSRFIVNNNVLLWQLNKITDVHGNYMTFDYHNADGEIYLTEIKYTGNTKISPSISPYNSVKFFYEDRTVDPTTAYIAGSPIIQKKLLRKIKTIAEGDFVKEFYFKYYNDPSSLDVYSRLVEIIENDSQGNMLNSTVTEWGSPTSKIQRITTNNQWDYPDPYGQSFLMGDIDGDGQTDVIRIVHYINSSNILEYDSWELYLTNSNGNNLTFINSGTLHNTYTKNFFIADFDGDGSDEFVIKTYYYDVMRNLPVTRYDLFKYDGSSLVYEYNFKTINSICSEEMYGDFDGDSKLDLFAKTSTDWLIFRYNKSNMDIGTGNSNLEDQIKIYDFNGDGISEIIAINNDIKVYKANENSLTQLFVNSYPNNDYNIYWGDFNGDSKKDILTWKAGQGWQLHYNNGSNNTWTNSNINVNLSDRDYEDDVYNYNLYCRDFNGDGKTDFLNVYKLSNGYTYFDVNYSLGASFLLESKSYSNMTPYYRYIYNFVDYNGDGKEDIFYYYSKDDPIEIFYFHPKEKSMFLQTVVDGFNHKTNIEYELLTTDNSNFYQKMQSGDEALIDFKGPLYSVFSVSSTNGTGTSNSISYSYKGANIHKYGKGFLGFTEVTSANTRTNIKTVTTFENSFTVGSNKYYYPMLKNTLTSATDGTSVKEITNTNTISELDIDTKRILPKASVQMAENHLLNSTAITTNTIDNNGNLNLSKTQYKQDGTVLVATTETEYVNYTDVITVDGNPNEIPNQPEKIIVRKQHNKDDGTNTYTRETTFEYNIKGAVEKKITDPGKTKALTTDYEYYPAGVLDFVTISATGLTDRSTSYEYDSKWRFTTKETNSLDNYTSAAYDNKTGNVLTSKDIYGNTTRYVYDGFGRLKETTLPSGKKITNTIKWCTTDITDLDYEWYYTETSPPGSGKVTTYYDILGREIRNVTKGFDGTDIYTDTKYNAKGQAEFVSQPYVAGTTPIWTKYSYDNVGRVDEENFDNDTRITDYQYTDRLTKVVNTSADPDQWSSKTINALGDIEKAEDMGGTINYKYHASGQPWEISAPESKVTITYDEYGMQETLDDPDAGIINYDYNAFGELTSQTDASGNTYQMLYDEAGRIYNKTGPDGTTFYDYYDSGNGKELPEKVTGPNGLYTSYTYDKYGRTTSLTEFVETGKEFTTSYRYDVYGRVDKITYPGNFSVTQHYNSYGYLSEVKRGDDNSTIWKGIEMDHLGQWVEYMQGKEDINRITRMYDDYGFPTRIAAEMKVDLPGIPYAGVYCSHYSFDPATGNLAWRERNNLRTGEPYYVIKEHFGYDELNRLEWYKVGDNATEYITYNNSATGTIHSKDMVGVYKYEGPQPHAITELENASSDFPSTSQYIGYTPFNKVDSINQNNSEHIMKFTYGPGNSRKKTEYYYNSNLAKTHYYSGNYEEEVTGSSIRKLYYINGGDGLAAIYENKNGTGKLYGILKDHLGSISVVLDENGFYAMQNFELQEYCYDAWGRRRNNYDLGYDNLPGKLLFSRGFTGHEHLDSLNLINMNGRVYDPFLGLFLSPDNYVQMPDFTQNFNRYGYALNNPLIYTDPDGKFIHLIIGAVIGGTFNWIANGAEFSWEGLGYFGIGAVSGALSAGVGSGISSAMAGGSFGAGFIGSSTAMTASTSFISGAAIGGGAGFTGGFVSGFGNGLMQGQNFGEALWSGTKYGLIGGTSGALIGGIAGGINAAYGDPNHQRNFWTGDDVEIGRTRFSLNNSHVSQDELYYVDSNGDIIRVSQYHNQNSRKINTRFWTNEGTAERFTHDLDLETISKPTSSTDVNIPQGFKIKGFSGIQTGNYYYPQDGGITFTSNNGLSRIITSPTRFSFSSVGLRNVNATIFGTGFNDGSVYAPFTFRVIIRLSKIKW